MIEVIHSLVWLKHKLQSSVSNSGATSSFWCKVPAFLRHENTRWFSTSISWRVSISYAATGKILLSCSRLENRRIPNDLWPLFLTWSWRRRICINAVLWVWDFDDLWLILHTDDVGFTCRFGTFYGLYNPTTTCLVWSEVSSLNLFDEFFKDQKACCSSVSTVYHAHLEVTCMVPQLQTLRDTDTPLCRVWQKSRLQWMAGNTASWFTILAPDNLAQPCSAFLCLERTAGHLAL